MKESEGNSCLYMPLYKIEGKSFFLDFYIKRKTQNKIHELEAQLEIASNNEAMAYKTLEKLTKQFNKLRAEKEIYENLVKENECVIKMKESQIVEENLKISRLEDRLDDYKQQTTNKLAKALEK